MWTRIAVSVLALIAAVATAPARAGADQGDFSRELSLFLVGHIEGRFAEVNCRDRDADPPLHFARQAGYYRSMAAAGREPLALNVGDSVFPGAVPRFLLSAPDPDPSLAHILARIPWAAHAIGKRELSIARDELDRFATQALDVDLSLQAANLMCSSEVKGEPLCNALSQWRSPHPWTIAERSGLRIGIVSLLDPATRSFVAKERLRGLELVDPEIVLSALVPRLRADHDVDLVVVLYHSMGAEGLGRAHSLATGTSGIDLVVTNETLPVRHRDARAYASGFTVARRTGTYLVGADTGHGAVATVNARVDWDGRSRRWRIRDLSPVTVDTERAPVDPDTADALRDARDDMCSAWGEPIQKRASFDGLLTMVEFRSLVLNVMRFATRSEMAIANTSAFRQPNHFPLSGTLTPADVNTVLAYNNQLAVLELEGSELEKLGKRLGGGVTAVGLESDGGDVRVNGRAIKKDTRYRLATNEFVATGGDGILDGIDIADKTLYQPTRAEAPPTIAAVVIDYVDNLRFPVAGWQTRTLDPDRNFPDLRDRFWWAYRSAVTASYTQVAVDNPTVAGTPAYGQPELSVASTNQLNLELRAGADADSRSHGWGNDLLLQYALTRTDGGEGDDEFQETQDLIRLKSQYRYNGVRTLLEDRWYAPIPFVELQAESEVTAPVDRDWHKLELTGIVGPEFKLLDPLLAKVGFDVQRDIAEPGDDLAYGLFAGYKLARFPLYTGGLQKTEVESELEYFLNRVGGDYVHELRSTHRLYVAILGQLSFTTTLSTFLFRSSSVGEIGFNTSLTAGLNFAWDAAVQSF